MKVNELVLARCINNKENDFVLGQLYVVDEIHIGQSSSSVRIDGIYCNSICFKYYDANMNEIDIYKSKYSPYFREEDKEIEEAKIKTFEDTGEAVTILRVHEYNDLNFKELKRVTDELIKAVNELKKGK